MGLLGVSLLFFAPSPRQKTLRKWELWGSKFWQKVFLGAKPVGLQILHPLGVPCFLSKLVTKKVSWIFKGFGGGNYWQTN